jgi:hypothetical protein
LELLVVGLFVLSREAHACIKHVLVILQVGLSERRQETLRLWIPEGTDTGTRRRTQNSANRQVSSNWLR